MLESALDASQNNADIDRSGNEVRNQALDFIHELGWLLHRNQLKSRLGHMDPKEDLFPLTRFRCLIEYSMDHEWCAVVRKLLNIMLDGNVSSGEHPSLNLALSELGLLHRAVRKNSRPLVDFLLRYERVQAHGDQEGFLFRPDVRGPAGLTPLHIAAGRDGSEDILDALTDDPGMVTTSI